MPFSVVIRTLTETEMLSINFGINCSKQLLITSLSASKKLPFYWSNYLIKCLMFCVNCTALVELKQLDASCLIIEYLTIKINLQNQ